MNYKYHSHRHESKPAPTLLTIYSGRECIGLILNRGKSGWEAFDADQHSLGIFATEQAAADAISGTAV
jgi:hypothetical protein